MIIWYREHIISLDKIEIIEKLSDIIAHLTPSQFIELVKDICIIVFILDMWYGTLHTDIKFWIICHILQEIKLFQTVWYTVKHTDIGLF